MKRSDSMIRSILAVVIGLLAWMVVATLLNRGLRLGIAGYTQAEPAMAFTLGMKIARLILGALSSIAAGATAGLIAPSKKAPAWVIGAIMLALFVPGHIMIWAKFPVWYHLTF